jgi:hypothetical protein
MDSYVLPPEYMELYLISEYGQLCTSIRSTWSCISLVPMDSYVLSAEYMALYTGCGYELLHTFTGEH